MTLTSVELFAGAGGLALGVEKAGFRSLATVEWNKWACDTIRNNIKHGNPLVKNWNVIEQDIRDFNWKSLKEPVDLLAGGPPCQPFSLGGLSRAHQDERDMFPALISVINQLRPKAFIVENVKGLLRKQFADYYRYILLRLENPEQIQGENEAWTDHLVRLQDIENKKSNRSDELQYSVHWKLLNAADYGVPQKRERVIIVGFRSDLDIDWEFPAPTHSKKNGGLHPWVTVREAIGDLPSPRITGSECFFNHELKPGAKVYPGHTGSVLDAPSKTLKAGVHGVPGGEYMLIQDDGEPRYYTVREAARIQTFPDDYRFDGTWSEAMRQLGNAVPVKLAEVIAKEVASKLA